MEFFHNRNRKYINYSGDFMFLNIQDNKINYKVSGVGPPLIFLHGWGRNLNDFDKVTNQINDDFTVYQLDLPGFGESSINRSLSVEKYADIINEFCLSLAINSPIIIGHSFGGRVAIMYASKYEVDKLVLIASPGIKQHFNLIKYLKIKSYKLLKKMNIKLNFGSKDYKNSSPILKETLVKAVNLDLTNYALKINAPTLLIYGEKDKHVPLYIAERLNKLIKNSALITIPKCGHFPFIEKYRHFLIVLKFVLLFLCELTLLLFLYHH